MGTDLVLVTLPADAKAADGVGRMADTVLTIKLDMASSKSMMFYNAIQMT